ncbi:regulatory protein, tetR family [Salinibacillus kushneri]|uniref:Regulatory protein, tetR family n=1 Tax=Salinibacillus kushneri TaxID=237682 RepID=A0A1I0F5P3_9BACI|nr:TetR/AcrR family transcriptional regulator [Salinibacillus kushneri]SET53179.1 regulatory protein, tetR family [Salinibacillus kushneri]
MPKKNELMNRAIQLFSEKGFYQTSVQEIAEAAGISKGAFYKYFDTKESLLIDILKMHYENMIKQVSSMKQVKGLTKREVLIRNLCHELEQWINNRDFFTVLFKNFPPSENKQVSEIMSKLKSSLINLHREILLDTYGEKIEPYITDIIIILEGILKEYIVTVIFSEKTVDVYHLSTFISTVMDSIVETLPNTEPVLTDYLQPEKPKERIKDCLNIIEEKVKAKNLEKYMEAVHLLREELESNTPKPFLMEALISYLDQEESIHKEVLVLERLYKRLIQEG